jgi:CRP-like cAMP-binding protein
MSIAASSIRHANRLIAALDDEDFSLLLPFLEDTELSFAQMVCVPKESFNSVYFPIDAVCSVLIKAEEKWVEVGLIGNEGMVGGALTLGIDSVAFGVVCHVSGRAIRISAADFKHLVLRTGTFQKLIQIYLQALFFQVAQHLACAKVHMIEGRFALWLLMIQDRVQKNEFFLTQELIAEMLSVRRESVSRVAKIFQNAGLINYNRGNLSILNRKGLEDIACECYRQIEENSERLVHGVALI